MSQAHAMLMQELLRYDSQCRASASLVASARNLEDLVRQMESPHLASWARSVRHSVQGPKALHFAAERRAEQLVEQELKKLDSPEVEEACTRLRIRVLPKLQGRFPSLAVKVAHAITKARQSQPQGSPRPK